MSETYTAEKILVDSIEAIRLTDSHHGVEVSICPSVGNTAYDMRVKGHPILMHPLSLGTWKQHPAQLGIPFLAPWANRLDVDAFWANGKRYLLNPHVVEIRRDLNDLPIHGLLLFTPAWRVTRLEAGEDSAEVTSRLEFWKHPEWMAQFPFAHSVEMTHRLSSGVLEVRTTIENHATDPLPLAIGFHPWYQMPEVPRDEWNVHLPVRTHYLLSDKLIPTGKMEPADVPDSLSLAGHQLDGVYGEVEPDGVFWLEAHGRKISVRFGPKFPIAIAYAPHSRDVVCFEPMTALTNGFNLAHEGLFQDLQSVAPGGSWTESFWTWTSGF